MRVVRRAAVAAALLSCSPPAARGVDLEGQALARVAGDVLAREACPRLAVRTFSLEDPRTKNTSGKLWVRECSARPAPSRMGEDELAVDVEILGWQWAGEAGWGFRVDEYVYFTASVQARLRTEIRAREGSASLRVWSPDAPRVSVREIGRVSARARTPASTLLGFASSLVGQGPNDLATASLRGRVADLIRDRARSGLALAVAEAPAAGRGGAPSTLLEEKQALFPGGALLSGSFTTAGPTELRYDVDGEVLVRPVCVSEAVATVAATVAGTPPPPTRPVDVLSLTGRGSTLLPPRACPWMLVSGAAGESAAVLALTLAPVVPQPHHTAHRWVKPTLLGFDLEGSSRRLVSVTIGRETTNAREVLGRPMTMSPALWLAGRPVELRRGESLVVEISSLRPRATWQAEARYDATLLGRGSLAPLVEIGHEERDVAIEANGIRIGRARLALDVVEIE